MSKRKRETADEESGAPEQHKITKKRKTNTTKASKAVPKNPENEGSAQVDLDSRNAKLARKLAKRAKRAPKAQKRRESKHKIGFNTREYDGKTGVVGVQEGKHSEKERTAAERGKEGGPRLTEKHKLKKEKRKDRTVQSSGKESKKKGVKVAKWNVSDPLGGQMLDVDPVFSPDEK